MDPVTQRQAGVVDDDVDAAEGLDRLLHHAGVVRARADVGADIARPTARVLDERHGRVVGFVVQSGTDDARAFTSQPDRDPPPDTAAGPGHPRDTAVEPARWRAAVTHAASAPA